jgi:hypothetical protein
MSLEKRHSPIRCRLPRRRRVRDEGDRSGQGFDCRHDARPRVVEADGEDTEADDDKQAERNS